jgi:glycosyltransferase involved in cell wall biosynthesis
LNTITKVIIPAYNEEKSIAKVIQDLPSTVDEIVVVSNNSSDETVNVAKKAGATVLTENRRGYGYACLKGISYIKSQTIKPDIIVFLDGDYSDYPKELNKLIAPIINEHFDFIVGARSKKLREKGSMTIPQIFGNWLATSLMAFFLIQNSQI